MVRFLRSLHIGLPCDLVPPLPGMDPEELKEGLEQMCLYSGYAALATIANVWKPPDGPWVGGEINHRGLGIQWHVIRH